MAIPNVDSIVPAIVFILLFGTMITSFGASNTSSDLPLRTAPMSTGISLSLPVAGSCLKISARLLAALKSSPCESDIAWRIEEPSRSVN